MNIAELLAIDVGAELRAVCRDQLQGSWQIPAELVRLVVLREAGWVEIEPQRHGFELRCHGLELEGGELHHLAVVLDTGREAELRHAALVALEEAEALALLWLAGVEGARVSMKAAGAAGSIGLRYQGEEPPELEDLSSGEQEPSLELRFHAPDFDSKRSIEWLRTACRFAPIPVLVHGKDVTRGFAGALTSVSLGRPLPGGIAITPTGDVPQLWLLRHGVLATRASVPGYPAFEAALEMGEETHAGATPAELRLAVKPFLPNLVGRVVQLIIDAAQSDEALGDEQLARICCLALRAARKELRLQSISSLPLIPVVEGEDRARRLATIEEISILAARQGNVLWSVSPGDADRVGGDSRTVLLLTPEMRDQLAGLLEVRIERPQPRIRGWVQHARFAIRRAVEWARRRMTELVTPRVLGPSELLDAEIELLEDLNRVARDPDDEPVDVLMCPGVGAIRRHRDRILLPRNNELVVRAARLAASDESWQYPVAVALLGDHALPAAEMRHQWLRNIKGGDAASPWVAEEHGEPALSSDRP